MNEENTNPTPAYEVRLNHLRITLWRNSVIEESKQKKGEKTTRVWFNTVITRRYLDKKSGEYRDSQTLNGLADLALAAEGIRLAQRFIVEHSVSGGHQEDDIEV